MAQRSVIHRKAGAFQGVLQLRNPTKELVEWVYKAVRKDGKARITLSNPVSGGIDLYFTNQRYLRALGNRIAQSFPGELKTSRKLHTLNVTTGKQVYRVTVMFRLARIRRGTTFIAGGKKYKVERVGKHVGVKEEKSGKKENWKLEQVLKFLP